MFEKAGILFHEMHLAIPLLWLVSVFKTNIITSSSESVGILKFKHLSLPILFGIESNKKVKRKVALTCI